MLVHVRLHHTTNSKQPLISLSFQYSKNRKKTHSSDEFTVITNVVHWYVCGADLLSDSTRFPNLHIGPPQFIEDFRFPGVNVAQDTDHCRTKIVQAPFLFRILLPLLEKIFRQWFYKRQNHLTSL